MRRLPILLLIMACVTAVSCRRTPKYVIDKEDMAQLLADLQIGESVVDMHHVDYPNDSDKIALREAIFAHHGVSSEQFDTSLVWYGHNIDIYLEVYERALKILEERDRSLGNALVQAARSVSGDSVNVWPGARYARINKRMPSRKIIFDIGQDENMEPGDIYTWRIKVMDDAHRTVYWSFMATYADSTVEWLNNQTSMQNWNQMTFATDSTKVLTNLCGIVEVQPPATYGQTDKKQQEQDLWIDSISLIRKRMSDDPEISRFRTRINTSKML